MTVGKTSKNNSCEGLVGKYGIGILSVFLIGDYAEVYTEKDRNTLLSLKIYIQNQKKQVAWLENKSNDFQSRRESFTVVRIHLKDDLKITNQENNMEMLGLESYVTKPENSITVNYMNERYEVPKIINKQEWILELPNHVKMYQFGYSNKEEYKLEDGEKETKKIMDKKGLILYNDIISHVEYEKSEYSQLKNIGIPFVILDIKRIDKAEKDVKTNLSRSSLQISGNVMNSIARGVYQLEIKK